MAEILNTTKINYHLERIIEEASTHIVIISPYMKIHDRLLNLLAEKISAEIALTVIYGKKKMEGELHDQLSNFDSTTIYFCPNLHAKVYANDEEAIVASLNLHEFSQINNYELGVLIQKAEDKDLFAGVLSEIEMIKKGSNCEKREVKSNPPYVPDYPKLSATQLAKLLKVKRAEVFQLLETNGLLKRQDDSWVLTEAGAKYGGEELESPKFGRYIVWPRDAIQIDR